MKVFVARASAAPGPTDFHFALDGELVTPPMSICKNPDCGCDRSVAGLASARATTGFVVADLDMSFTEYVVALRDGLQRQGWWVDQDDDGWLLDDARQLAAAASVLPTDVELRIERDHITVRSVVP